MTFPWPWPRHPALKALAALWVATPTALGVLVALLLWPLAWWRFSWALGAVELVARGPLGTWMRKRQWAAVTYGLVIMCWESPDTETRLHERVHVEQCFRWGPAILVAYPLASWWRSRWTAKVATLVVAALAAMAFGGYEAYRGNPFEVDAYDREHEAP